MVNPKNYTGPPLPCGWPGCQAILKNPSQHHTHCTRCFGHGLPALNTGIKCDILNCRCSGVDFPSTERLLKHKHNMRKVGLNSENKKQCLSPGCGCGRWYSSLSIHLAKARLPRQRQTASGADLRPSNKYKTLDEDQEKRKINIQHISEVKEEGKNHINQDIGSEHITIDRIKRKHNDEDDDDYDDDDWDPEYLPPSKSTKSNKSSTVKAEGQDHVSSQRTHPMKRKRDLVDLTQDTDDDDAPSAFKKVTVAFLLAPHANLPAIAQAEVATKAPVASSTAAESPTDQHTEVATKVPIASSAIAESHATDHRNDNVTMRDLINLLKSQQSQISMLTKAVLERK